MTGSLFLVWPIFIALCVVCTIGVINIVRAARLGDVPRTRNLLMGCLVVGIFTFSLGFFLFSPRHDMKTSRDIMLVAMALNAVVLFVQWRGIKNEPPSEA